MANTNPTLSIELDPELNQWRFAKRAWRPFGKGRGHRFEAAILLCLAEQPAGEAVPLSFIQVLIRDKGQAADFHPAGFSRLFESINMTGETAGEALGSWAWRIVGGKTAGAWTLELAKGVKLSRNPAIPQSRNPAIPQSRNPAIFADWTHCGLI
ncbi:MAG: hypothetical protein RLZZ495_905 [Pseudomonadota bacterium]